MKICLFVLSFCVLIGGAFTQDNSFEKVLTMSSYIGKSLRDIPDEYVRSPDGSYLKSLSDTSYEGFIVERNIVRGFAWVLESNVRSYLFSEFDRLKAFIVDQFGDPLLSDGILYWGLDSYVLGLVVDGTELCLMLATPEILGLSRSQWESILRRANHN